jgi:hypothetical protein
MPLGELVGGENARKSGKVAQTALYMKCVHLFRNL